MFLGKLLIVSVQQLIGSWARWDHVTGRCLNWDGWLVCCEPNAIFTPVFFYQDTLLGIFQFKHICSNWSLPWIIIITYININ